MPHFLTPLLDAAAGGLIVAVEGRDVTLATKIEAALDGPSRKQGLLGRTGLAPDTVLILAPCNAIHTFKMQFAIDAIFADRSGRVLKISRALPASRMSVSARAFATLEMAAGEAERHGLQRGDVLTLRPS